jgi:ferritin-like metal-binding protein YciE
MTPPLFAPALHEARALEKEQALFYRVLSAQAEEHGNTEDIEALNELLADEQHHLSRLSNRLVELGEELAALNDAHMPSDAIYENWRDVARIRERKEVARYEAMLQQELDDDTARMIRSFLDTERQHEAHLAGKYTDA